MARGPTLPFAARWSAGSLIKSTRLLLAAMALPAGAAQIDITGPPGSGAFGTKVAVLPNGNIVVTDPNGPVSNVGAVYLYSPTGVLISTLTGSTLDDHVGDGGITVLANGNYVIRSMLWNNAGAVDAGAVTWADGDTGISGVVSESNSLVGTHDDDRLGSTSNGFSRITALANGNYVVVSRHWNDDVGAATWGDGSTGVKGAVSQGNSRTGESINDLVGLDGVVELSDGNYVIVSPAWNDSIIGKQTVGAVTWANGSGGDVPGPVSLLNSLLGASSGDSVGDGGVTALANGHYVVNSPFWNNGTTMVSNVGAVTWANADGSTGRTGRVTTANSLVGTRSDDRIGSESVTALSNGNYVVASPMWNVEGFGFVGAVTWVNGGSGLTGTVSAANSLIGTLSGDAVGSGGITALSNGNYVVSSPSWGDTNVGAVTWGNGSAVFAGVVSPSNSLVGTAVQDEVGVSGVKALVGNGNYVVLSQLWDNGGLEDVGAATWCNGSIVSTGSVSASNSMVGTKTNDRVGIDATVLSNGNYVIRSFDWNSDALNVGAVTWVNGTTGLPRSGPNGTLSQANSLVGASLDDRVGLSGVVALSNGNYVVASQQWDCCGLPPDVGAATWANGGTGRSGLVTPANSLIGTSDSDLVGSGLPQVTAFSDGNYAVRSPSWSNGGTLDAGAVTLLPGTAASSDTIRAGNSVLGTVQGGGSSMVFDYDPTLKQLVVGRPASNIVSLFKLPTNALFANGFE